MFRSQTCWDTLYNNHLEAKVFEINVFETKVFGTEDFEIEMEYERSFWVNLGKFEWCLRQKLTYTDTEPGMHPLVKLDRNLHVAILVSSGTSKWNSCPSR